MKNIRTLFTVMVWICLAFSVVFLINDNRFPSADQWKTVLAQDKIEGTLCLVLITILCMVLRGIRWGVLLSRHINVIWMKLIPVFGWCFILAALSPLRSGELIRAWWVKRQGGSGMTGAGVLLIERTTDLVVLLFFAAVLSTHTAVISAYHSNMVMILTGAVLLIYFVFIYAASPLAVMLDGLKKRLEQDSGDYAWKKLTIKTVTRVQHFSNGISALRHVRVLFPTLGFTALIWLMLGCGFYMYLKAFFPYIPASAAAVVLLCVNLSGIVWVAPGNLGIYEMAAVLALRSFELPLSEAIVAAAGLHFVVFCSSLVSGLLCRGVMRLQGLHFRELV